MIDLNLLNKYVKTFQGSKKEERTELEQKISESLSLKDRWLLKRFLDGYFDKSSTPIYDKIILIPTTPEVEKRTLEVCKEGIEQYFIGRIGLNFTVDIGTYNHKVTKAVKKYRVQTDKGLETTYPFTYVGDVLRNSNELPLAYISFVENSDFFESNKDGQLTGRADEESGVMVVLERALKKGKFENGRFVDRTNKEKAEYMKLVAAHEIYHIVGRLSDLNQDDHRKRDLPEKSDCLGYSRFQIPANLCEGCADGIRALWYGIQLRTGKKYIKIK